MEKLPLLENFSSLKKMKWKSSLRLHVLTEALYAETK